VEEAAGACCAEAKNAGVSASNRKLKLRFTVILPIQEIRCASIESHVSKKVVQFALEAWPFSSLQSVENHEVIRWKP
jgi:hypothetical protein